MNAKLDWNVPAHVPPELVVDVDLYNMPGGDTDPAGAWRQIQGRGPLVYSPRNGGHWIAAAGEDMPKLYRDFEHFSSRQVVIPDPGNVLLPIQTDPPIHARHRQNIIPLFSPDAIIKLDPQIRALTISLIEGFKARGECDFVNEFSFKLPLMIFLRMMGLPLEDLPYLRSLVEVFIRDPDPLKKFDAHNKFIAYLDGWLNKRTTDPRDDGITLVTKATIDGRPYTREEMHSTCVLLLLAGLDTVANILAFIAHHLAQHPEQRQYIRENGAEMNTIVQEFLRRFPIANANRVIPEDWVYRGIQLKKGDRIALPASLFNLDPSQGANPDKVDLTRTAKHITFGSGPHTCAGALLARKEIAIFLEEWLTRIPDFEVDSTRPPKFNAAPLNAVYELYLKWPVPKG